MDQPRPIPTDEALSDFEPRSRAHGAAQGLWITVVEIITAIVTVLIGFALGAFAAAGADSPEFLEYLDYTAYSALVAPATAAIAAVIAARRLRLGIPVLYLIPMGVPIGIAVAAHEATAIWFAPLVLLLPLGNVALGAAFPGHRREFR